MEEKKQETKPVEKVEEKKVETTKVTTANKEKKEEAKKQEAKKVDNKKVTTTKKDKKNANNNIMIIGVAVVAVVLVAIIACVFLMKDSPKKVVEKTFNDAKTGAYTQNVLAGFVQEENNLDAEVQKLLFEKLEWKVLNEKQEGEKATVEVEITNKDFKTIMGNYKQKVLKAAKAAFSGQGISEDEMMNYLMEELRNEEIQTVTANQSLSLEKRDGKWEITDEENFVNSILPGLYEAISAFN